MGLVVKDGSGNAQSLPTTSSGATVHALEVAGSALSSNNPMPCADPSNAPFQGVIAIVPGTPFTAGRSLAFICTASGSITMTLADSSTLTIPVTATVSLQTLPFAVTNVVLGQGTTATLWNLK